MISVVLPYWNRKEATDKSLEIFSFQYPNLDMEVVIVDDGSPESYTCSRSYPWPVSVIRLPDKDVPKNPCTPINVGVRASQGDIIVLSNPETEHILPVFDEMRLQLIELGVFGYVMAAAWCPDQKRWNCHSKVKPAIWQPKGSGLHFCSMLYRELWDLTGGFDEDYREGAGYDDNDFVMRLYRAGAKFCLRDDLLVSHRKSGGAVTKWLPWQHKKNKEIYFSKWGVNVNNNLRESTDGSSELAASRRSDHANS